MNTKLLEVVTPPSIYHSCSTWKTFWEKNFTPVNMKSCGRHSVWKHREIKNNDQYINLGISLKFGNLEKLKITSSEPKYYLGISGKGLINYMGLINFRRPSNIKKARFSITAVSLTDLYNIIK